VSFGGVGVVAAVATAAILSPSLRAFVVDTPQT